MEASLVSVIVPVYNVEKYVEKCLDSICSQTYTNIEIIVVNDGTKDSSADICKRIAESDSRITVIDKPNGGLASARNAALEVVKGKYVVCVDSDDWVENKMVETLVNAIESYNCDMAVCNFYKEDEFGNRDGQTRDNDIEILSKEEAMLYAILPDKYYGFAWNKIYKKDILGKQRYTEAFLKGEDSPFTCEYINKCKRVVYLHTPLYHYRIDSVSITRSSFSKKKMSVLDSYMSIIDMLTDLHYSQHIIDSQKVQYANQLLSLSVNICRSEGSFNVELKYLFREMKKYKTLYLASKNIDKKHKALYRISFFGRPVFRLVCKAFK